MERVVIDGKHEFEVVSIDRTIVDDEGVVGGKGKIAVTTLTLRNGDEDISAEMVIYRRGWK